MEMGVISALDRVGMRGACEALKIGRQAIHTHVCDCYQRQLEHAFASTAAANQLVGMPHELSRGCEISTFHDNSITEANCLKSSVLFSALS